LRTQNRSLRALNQVAHAISHCISVDEILEKALHAAVRAVEADIGVIRLYNPATQLLYLAAVSGVALKDQAVIPPVAAAEGPAGAVFHHQHIEIGRKLPGDSWLYTVADCDLFDYLYVPMRTGNTIWMYVTENDINEQIIGVLGVVSKSERAFTDTDVRLLTTIGTQISIAVSRIQYATGLRNANIKLEATIAELRNLDQMRDQFIQNVTHELRTPLSLVQGYVGLLADGVLTPEQQQEALVIASNRIKSLVEIVEAITTLQDIGRKTLDLKKIQPGELLQTVTRMAMQKARAHHMDIHVEKSEKLPDITGDYTKLVQAIHQLLDNAIKFSPDGSTIEIGVSLTPDGQSLCFWVNDYGIGIPVEEFDHIFELFYQVDGSATRQFGGMGLGLALVKEIVDLHNGRMEVQSEINQGSCFSMLIPLSQDTADEKPDSG
ncbi:MAG: ATP-binding protein, partial [Anaerolineae bacterium]|nr:ATP-binding protein [Anaerolineae bacterium]